MKTAQAVALILVGLAALASPNAVAQTVWVPTATTGPSPRSGHAMVYDSVRQRVVLFGGEAAPLQYLGDTWEWDGATWTLVDNAGPARKDHAMAFDPVRNRIVLDGGVGVGQPWSSGFLGETWEWDGTSWSHIDTSGLPLTNHAMAFDPHRQKVVRFGGTGSNGSAQNDLDEWTGTQWQPIASVGPNPTFEPLMVHDGARSLIVMVGERSAQNEVRTWEWDGAAWTLAAIAGAPHRVRSALAFDDVRGQSILFGGDVPGQPYAGDLWTWTGAAWSMATPFAPSPSARSGHAMAFDSHRNRLVMFGGANSLGYLGDTWELLPPTTATTTSYGTSCGAPPVAITPRGSSRPVLGQAQVCDIDNAYLGIALVAWGLSNEYHQGLQLPLPLDTVGMNGCLLLQSAEELTSGCTSTSWTTAEHTLPIPFDQQLLGLHVYLQAWTFAPGFNPLGLATSNGIELLIGDV
jgi:hypothetical protein